MEEEFKKNKNKQDKNDKDESTDSSDKGSDDVTKNKHEDASSQNIVSEASVIVESVGASGNVERLRDD